MACLSVSLLGPLIATQDGQPVNSFEYNKVKGLFSYLIVEADRPHRRDALAGLLWPDQSQKAAVDSLRNALSKLRQAIDDRNADPPYLFITNDAIQFNRASEHKLDLNHFSQVLTATDNHRHRRIESCTSCTQRLKLAADVYRGELLEGFSLPDSDLFEDWLRGKREKYAQLAQGALHHLASIFEWRCEYDQSLLYTRRQLELDPCRESAHLRAMRLLAAQGLRAEALEQYEQCRVYLANELGVGPSQDTTHLYEQIKYGAFQVAPTRRKVINNLPSNMTSFVGREHELEEIDTLIDDPNCRLLTLVGPGGVGKTRLAIAAARLQLEMFPDGIYFVSLSGINSCDYIIPTMLEALELTPSSQGEFKEQLLSYLEDKELVLILDNFDHLLDGAGILTEILEKAPLVMVLVTSRHRLNRQAEWLYEVGGLNYPVSPVEENLDSYDAVQLFIQRLHQVKPQIKLCQEDLYNLNRICHLVDGLPLGIELAASAVRMRTLLQVAEALESGKEQLEISLRDVPERHHSLRAVFDQSWNLLDQQERSVLSGLAVFRGGFSIEAGQKVAGASPIILTSLLEHSIMRFDPQKGRYDLHELIRQFALEKLIMSEKEPSFRQKHLYYFIELAEREDDYFNKVHLLDHVWSLKLDIENFRLALEESVNNGQFEQALQLAGALGFFWANSDLWQEGDARLIKILESGYEFPHNRILARGLMRAGLLAQDRDPSIGRELLQNAISIWQELNDQSGIAYTLSYLAEVAKLEGDTAKAMELLEESLSTYSLVGDKAQEAWLKVVLAASLFDSGSIGEMDKAKTLFQAGWEYNRDHGLATRAAVSAVYLGYIEMNRGNYHQARTVWTEGLELIKDRRNDNSLALLNALGLASLYLKDYAQSNSYFKQILEILNETGLKYLTGICNYSYLVCCEGDYGQAYYYLTRVFRQMENLGNLWEVCTEGGLEQLAGVLSMLGEPDKAVKLFAFSDFLHTKFNSPVPMYLRTDYERNLSVTRNRLGEDHFKNAWEEGRAMTLEQAKACVLDVKVHIPRI